MASLKEIDKFAAFSKEQMTLKERIEAFSGLGSILKDSLDGRETRYSTALNELISKQQYLNPWFTPDNTRLAVKTLACQLSMKNLTAWTGRYPALEDKTPTSTVGIIMAGNIPLVGFHDLLSVLISGNRVLAKTSSKDPDLIVFISNILCSLNPGFRESIDFTEGLLKGFDKVIATGSDNSSRYFEYYFGRYPHIIRKNRNGVAVLDGKETNEELSLLGSDIFTYFGLGCRSVSKLYVPEGCSIRELSSKWNSYSDVVNHSKYANNYDYNKAIYMVNREEFTDNGFLLLKENSQIPSPVAVLHYQYYTGEDEIGSEIRNKGDKIQCVVSRKEIPFGKAQNPELWDYADGIDTLEFLLKKY